MHALTGRQRKISLSCQTEAGLVGPLLAVVDNPEEGGGGEVGGRPPESVIRDQDRPGQRLSCDQR